MKKLLFVFILIYILNCTKEIQPSREDTSKIYEQAMKAYTEQKYKEANDLFLAVIKKSDTRELTGNALFYLGEINKTTENYGKALISYAAASTYGIKTDENVKEMASLADLNSLEKAVTYVSEEIKPFLLYTLATKLQSEGRENESEKYFSEIVSNYPRSEYARKAKYISHHKGRIRVGVLLPISGTYRQDAASVKNGIEIGSKDRFYPLYVDTKENPVKSYKEAVKLIQQEKVSGIIGPLFSRNSFAIACLCDYVGIPYISPTATKEFIDSTGKQSYIINRTIEQQAIAMANYAIHDLGLRTFSILYPYSDYGETFESVFSTKINELGGTIVNSIYYKEGKRDFQDELKTIKAGNPDAIYIPATTSDVPAIASQVKYLGIKSQILGSDEWKSEEIFRQQVEASALEGVIITDSPFHPTKTFLDEFNLVFNREPDRYACLGYDAAVLMETLISNPKDKEKLKDIQLTAGSLGSQSSYRNVSIYIINNGAFKLIK